MFVGRALLRGAVFAALFAGAPANVAAAATRPAPPSAASKAACVAAHEEAQTLRTQKKPHAAREKFVACARAECPLVLRKECGEQMAAVEASAPSVALEARDDKGSSDPDVQVSIDGVLVAERLTGASVAVEPGEHTFRFERGDGRVIEQKVLVVEGEKNRKVVAEFVTLRPSTIREDEPPPPPDDEHVPPLAYVAGGVAIVALGSFAFFASQGSSAEDDLAGKCAPSCTDEDVKPVQRDYLVADVSLGLALAFAVAAVVLALPALTSSRTVTTTARAAAPPWFPKTRTRSAVR